LSSEIELCKGYFDKQIEISKPKTIIALGSVFNYIMKTNENIIEISGKMYDYKGIKFIPLIDPEFIYKNPSYRPNVYSDLKKIKNLLEIK
jgi:uracil-DNA glycosylase family 4